MRALLLRLSALDADAEGAVRVIAVFDQLVRQHLGLNALARATAQLAECPVGLSDSSGRLVRRAPDGSLMGGNRPATVTAHPIEGGGQVWLERSGEPLPLDQIVLERFAAAAAIQRELESSALPRLGDPALVELVISDVAAPAERSRALHLMGLRPTTPMRVLAVVGDVAALPARLHPVGHAPIENIHAVLVRGDETVDPTPNLRVGIGSTERADEVWRSWRRARVAVRFADAAAAADGAWVLGGPVVDWNDLGGFAVLTEHVPVEEIAKIPDVQALDRLAAGRSGPIVIATLHAVCINDSIRHAAVAMHLHHSSVTARLERAEGELGFCVRTPSGRIRLALALTLRHLRH
jgi:hypothetical protein